MCYQKHYPPIGKLYKTQDIRGGDTLRFEEMWRDRVKSCPGVDPARPRQQSNIQQSKRVRVAGNMETENKAFLPQRGIQL